MNESQEDRDSVSTFVSDQQECLQAFLQRALLSRIPALQISVNEKTGILEREIVHCRNLIVAHSNLQCSKEYRYLWHFPNTNVFLPTYSVLGPSYICIPNVAPSGTVTIDNQMCVFFRIISRLYGGP